MGEREGEYMMRGKGGGVYDGGRDGEYMMEG